METYRRNVIGKLMGLGILFVLGLIVTTIVDAGPWCWGALALLVAGVVVLAVVGVLKQ